MESVRRSAGDVYVPVFIEIADGRGGIPSISAKYITDEMIQSLNEGAFAQRYGSDAREFVKGPLFGPEANVWDRELEL